MYYLYYHLTEISMLIYVIYHLVMTNIAMENPLSMEVLMGTSSIDGQFSTNPWIYPLLY